MLESMRVRAEKAYIELVKHPTFGESLERSDFMSPDDIDCSLSQGLLIRALSSECDSLSVNGSLIEDSFAFVWTVHWKDNGIGYSTSDNMLGVALVKALVMAWNNA